MRVFVYEFVTGGGFLCDGSDPPEPLRREGAAMLGVLVEDFARINDVHVVTLHDRRWHAELPPHVHVDVVASVDEEQSAFRRWAAAADWTVVIAPEIDNQLLRRCRLVRHYGGRLLGPEPDVVALASDKHAMATHLAAVGIRVPEGCPIEPGESLPKSFPYPAVLKPRWGAGSHQMQLVRALPPGGKPPEPITCPSRLERFCNGMAVSVAVLCGPGPGKQPRLIPMPMCRQSLADDGGFAYLGGSLPVEVSGMRQTDSAACLAAAAAVKTALQAAAALPDPTGYLGVDLVLGHDPQGRENVVIEINPRLTTSYVGLRALADEDTNLAAAMLAVRGGHRPRLSFRPAHIEFLSDGTVRDTPWAT